ncbi:hypothetical protein D3C74_494610 [compost metagenome]
MAGAALNVGASPRHSAFGLVVGQQQRRLDGRNQDIHGDVAVFFQNAQCVEINIHA